MYIKPLRDHLAQRFNLILKNWKELELHTNGYSHQNTQHSSSQDAVFNPS